MKVGIYSYWREEEVMCFDRINDSPIVNYDDILNIPDHIIHKLIAARKAETKAYLAFTKAVEQAKQAKARCEWAVDLIHRRAQHEISRSEIHTILLDNGWFAVSTSMYKKINGPDNVCKMHDAFNEFLGGLKSEIEEVS